MNVMLIDWVSYPETSSDILTDKYEAIWLSY